MGRPQLLDHMGDILPAVQAALCDSNTAVREAAGAAFAILSKGSSGSAVDSVVPSMLSGALKEVLRVHSILVNHVATRSYSVSRVSLGLAFSFVWKFFCISLFLNVTA